MLLQDYGREHVETGNWLVYTSADSVFQLAAHEEVVPLSELYAACETARELLCGEHAVGRVIARPFVGEYPAYVRTANRRDFSLEPPTPTMLDALIQNGYECKPMHKVRHIYVHRQQ